ncbi:MAG: hypothetical protein ACTSSE_18610, partial [Candidatus Thorarchaeota archaeon]
GVVSADRAVNWFRKTNYCTGTGGIIVLISPCVPFITIPIAPIFLGHIIPIPYYGIVVLIT